LNFKLRPPQNPGQSDTRFNHAHIMSEKSKPKATESKLGPDLATFEQLPEKTKELMKLKDLGEKTTGPEQVEAAQKIKEKTRK